MTTEALKSTSITNADATPVLANTAGKGAPSRVKAVGDYVTVSASMAAGSTYRLVRIPSACVVKQVLFESEAQGAGKFQIGVYYSDSTNDGTPQSVTPSTAINVNLFANDIDCASAVLQTDKTYTAGASYTLDKRNQPLWQAAGLSTDPGGYFDVVATVHTTDVTTGTGKLGVLVKFCE